MRSCQLRFLAAARSSVQDERTLRLRARILAWRLWKDRRPLGARKILPSLQRPLCRAIRRSPARVRSCLCWHRALGARAAERNRGEYSDEVRVARRWPRLGNRWGQSRWARSSARGKLALDAREGEGQW